MGKRRSTLMSEMDDASLVQRYQERGEPEALDAILQRYRRFARAKARGYFLIGGDSDDVEQEALIVGMSLLARTGDAGLQRAARRVLAKVETGQTTQARSAYRIGASRQARRNWERHCAARSATRHVCA